MLPSDIYNSSIINSTSTGTVSGGFMTGGLCGAVVTSPGSTTTIKGCSINAEAYAIYSINSYVALTDYTIQKGTIRCDEGSVIKTVDKGATDKRPVFNNSD